MPEFPAIKDIAAPVEPVSQAVTPWAWWIAAVILGLLVLFGLFLWLRAIRRRVRLPALPLAPGKAALEALEGLRRQAEALPAEEFAESLSTIVRTFLQRQTGVLALYATSPEILGDRPRAGDPPPPPAIAAFREALLASDALKYGAPRAENSLRRKEELIDKAIAAIRLAELPPVPAESPASPPPLSLRKED